MQKHHALTKYTIQMNAMFWTVTSAYKNESNIDISLDTMLPTSYLFIPNFILYVIFNWFLIFF